MPEDTGVAGNEAADELPNFLMEFTESSMIAVGYR